MTQKHKEMAEEILNDYFGENEYRELELGEKIMEGDVYLFQTSHICRATDTGSVVYTTHHWPHYRMDK